MKEKIARIKKLPPNVVSKIAAGEVVENPASVVRELIENALDAGATEIKVELEEAGLRLIKVQDNGEGMSEEELKIAAMRYTTSKIEKEEDLENVRTLGFRGEALFSIAAVSKLTMISMARGEEGGYLVRYNENGEPEEIIPAPHPFGTTVEVRSLFKNFPARRKFLSSPYYEIKRVLETVTEYALSHPQVGFTVVIDGRETLNLPPSERKERIENLLGIDFVEDSVWVNYEIPRLKIYGFVSKPDRLKESPKIQYIFVNGRRVREDKLRSAIVRAYGSPKGYPEYVLYFEVDPSMVDFNIHPQKKAVKFSSKLRLYERVLKTIGDALGEKEELRLTTSQEKPFVVLEGESCESYETGRQLELGELRRIVDTEGREEYYYPDSLWQIHDTYIIAQVKSGFLLIDQHAAHERIIYERLKSKKTAIQFLLFPYIVHLTPSQFKTYEELETILYSLGFRMRKLSMRTVIVEGIPDIFRSLEKEEFIGILEELAEYHSLPDRFENLLKTISCKAAIKAGQKLKQEEMSRLIDELFACENPFFCPHGRPTMLRFTLEEIERKLGRR